MSPTSDDLRGKVPRPRERKGITHEFYVQSRETGTRTRGFITIGKWVDPIGLSPKEVKWEDGKVQVEEREGELVQEQPFEVFIRLSKQGSTLAGLVDSIAILISNTLQNRGDMKDICHSLINQRFEPMGETGDPVVPRCSSIPDYIARRLAVWFLSDQDLIDIGMRTPDGRLVDPMAKTDLSGPSNPLDG